MNPALATEISRLTPKEKLLLVGELWDEIVASEDELPIPDWHRRLLKEDEARYKADPLEGAPWPDVKASILRKP